MKENGENILISESQLSSRIINCLSCHDDLKYLKDLDGVPVHRIIGRNLGKVSLNQIQSYIKYYGFSLKFPEDRYIERVPKDFTKKLFDNFNDKDVLNWIFNLSKMLKDRKSNR